MRIFLLIFSVFLHNCGRHEQNYYMDSKEIPLEGFSIPCEIDEVGLKITCKGDKWECSNSGLTLECGPVD